MTGFFKCKRRIIKITRKLLSKPSETMLIISQNIENLVEKNDNCLKSNSNSAVILMTRHIFDYIFVICGHFWAIFLATAHNIPVFFWCRQICKTIILCYWGDYYNCINTEVSEKVKMHWIAIINSKWICARLKWAALTLWMVWFVHHTEFIKY